MGMVNIGTEQITSVMIGEMGIKTVAVGAETVYTRPGGYFYIALETEEKE